jgi:MFS family permease
MSEKDTLSIVDHSRIENLSGPRVSNARAWYMVSILMLAYIVGTVDRQILSLLVEPIKSDLHISDTGFSLLGGFAFAIFYTLLGLPLGYLADHTSRKKIISAGILTWSVMTTLCGSAGSYLQLFLYRIGVGAGESTLGPAASSIITDLFPPKQLGGAMGVFIAGTSLGSGIALIGGGALIAYLSAISPVSLPVLGIVQPWQLVFFCLGVPGIIVAILLAFGTEPKRKVLAGQASVPTKIGLSDALAVLPYLKGNRHLYLALIGSFSLIGVMLHAFLLWTPSFFMRSLGWSAMETGTSLGILLLVFGTIGSLGGGLLLNIFQKRCVDVAAIRVAICCTSICMVSTLVLFLMPSSLVSLFPLAVAVLSFWALGPIMQAAILSVTDGRYIGRISAFTYFLTNMIGMGMGPLLVGLLTDFVFKDEALVGTSLAIVLSLAGMMTIGLLFGGIKPFRAATEPELQRQP